jgi:membrane-associated phospholipid phosphatase
MKKILLKHKFHWKNKEFQTDVFLGSLLFILSLLANHFASIYVNKMASNYVTDILLDNLPVVDVDGILVYGALLFFIFVAGCLFAEPRRLPFVLKSAGLFYLIRSVFIILTHLGPIPVQTPIEIGNILNKIISDNDFFFSGHAGFTFLIALIFWDEKWIRNVSLITSLIFSVSVILGHLHYSIDVFAAFFITYSIFHISQRIFKKDYNFFSAKENN